MVFVWHDYCFASEDLTGMGKLIQVLQRTTSGPERISTLTEALSAANFMVLLAAVRELCGYDETSHSFNKGSLALKIGYSLKRCKAILKSQAAKTGNSVLKEQAHAFEAGLMPTGITTYRHRKYQEKPAGTSAFLQGC